MFKDRIKSHPTTRLFAPKMASFEELMEHLDAHESREPGVIYLHVPFCDHICSFCAMNRSKLGSELDSYVQQLLVQIRLFARTKYFASKPISSVYFGGGTPSVLKTDQFVTILDALRANFCLSEDAEICSESTLHNLSISKLKALSEHGLNRISIGIQSFNTQARKYFNRTGDEEYARTNMSKIREQFSGTLCCDIIYSYPEQSEQNLLEDARLCDELGIDSVSFYSLIHFENSALAKLGEMSYSMQSDLQLHQAFLGAMQNRGFRLLEHTKLVKDDEYRYIRLSHAGCDVLPLGVGAGGSVAGFGMYTPRANMQLISKIDPLEHAFKRFYNKFQYQNIALDEVFKILNNAQITSEVMGFLAQAQAHGYVNISDGRLSYSNLGVFFGNNIASQIIEISKSILLKETTCK